MESYYEAYKIKKRACIFNNYFVAIDGITTVSVLFATNNNNGELSYYEIKCKSFEVQNANLSPGQIVFIGDSITDGCALDTFYGDLKLAVYNRGIGGDNTSGVLNRLQTSVFDLKPSKIVMMIGTNDINGNINQEKILENYREILRQFKANLPEADVICVSIIPQNKQLEEYTPIKVDETTQTILQINPLIESLVQEFGYTYVDLFSSLADSNNMLIAEYSPDGIHLNSAGYTIYSSKIKHLLEE